MTLDSPDSFPGPDDTFENYEALFDGSNYVVRSVRAAMTSESKPPNPVKTRILCTKIHRSLRCRQFSGTDEEFQAAISFTLGSSKRTVTVSDSAVSTNAAMFKPNATEFVPLVSIRRG